MSFDTQDATAGIVSGPYPANGEACDVIGSLEQRSDTDGFGSSSDKDFFFVDARPAHRCTADAVASEYQLNPAECVIPGNWVRPVGGDMCGFFGWQKRFDHGDSYVDSATQTTYYAEIQRLDWDHTSSERSIYAPIAALARHAFDRLQQFHRFDRVRVVNDPLYGGAVGRVVEVCGFDITVSVNAALPLAGPATPCNVLLGQRSFVVRVDSSRREWKLGDVFWVRAGDHLGSRATAVKGGNANVIELVQTSHPRLTFTAHFSDLEFDFAPEMPQRLEESDPSDFAASFSRFGP
ncbi:hypothetical protein B0H14DRAFT_2624905 [Mycena olivaceomarginata]|nr:hypothetical protein B0H14DRAFT_2624905 [Mycena olivaceomarginata]